MNKPVILTSAVQRSPNLRELLTAVNSASATAQASAIVLIVLAAYYFVALGGVSDRGLLLQAPVSLPALGMPVGLHRFFLFAPAILVFAHLGALVQHAVLARKARALAQLLETREIAETATTGKACIDGLRYEVSSYFFTQALAGPPESGIVRFFQRAIAWSVLAFLPLGVLLGFQIAFLPFHDAAATWLHRGYVALDIFLLAFLGVFLTSSERDFWRALGAGLAIHPGFYAITALALIAFFFAAFAVATVPDERLDRALAIPGLSVTVEDSGGEPGAKPRLVFAPTAALFEGPFDEATVSPRSLFHRNLIVTDANIAGGGAISLRYRDLRYGRFDRSDLSGADLTCADLTGASLTDAKLDGAKQGCPGR